MDRIWSPWRYRYISTAEPKDACIFCAKSQENRDEENYILHRGRHNFVMLNLFPYTSGHLMIAPYSHLATLEEASDEVATELMQLTRLSEIKIRSTYRSPGLNLGMNIGAAAGAGIAGHIHMHVLPRWPGDANFMTTVGETRVLPEEIGDTFSRLRAAFQA